MTKTRPHAPDPGLCDRCASVACYEFVFGEEITRLCFVDAFRARERAVSTGVPFTHRNLEHGEVTVWNEPTAEEKKRRKTRRKK